MRYLLDTSVCIPLINGTDEQLKNRLLEHAPASVLLCSVVKAELLFGARYSSRAAENLDRISRFCRVFESLPFDDEAAQHYGGIRAQLKREGRPIGANDLLIAATALAADSTLVTRNLEEFKRVPGLMVDDWR
jgi:tRNA(fMet)-specific endonuclease VapC